MFPTRSEFAWSVRRALGVAIEFATLGEVVYEPEYPGPAQRPAADRFSQARFAPGSKDHRAHRAGESGWDVSVAETAAEPEPRPAPPAFLPPATAAARRALAAAGGGTDEVSPAFGGGCPHAGRSAAAA